MADIKEFRIDVPQLKLDLLRQKLELTTFPDELDEAGWDYGAPLAEIKRLVAHWLDGYDWRAAERRLNAFPQYTTVIDVDGFGPLDIHFVHQKSTVGNAVPLLFCHGWPGSFVEVTKMLPELVAGDGDGPAFDVVAPSLPNFGWSEGVKKKGFGPRQYAEVCHKLMLRLGYSQYVTQGGDWGYVITRVMGLHYPSHCRASHLNLQVPSWPGPRTPLAAARFWLSPWQPGDQAGIARAKWFASQGNGYFKQQSTRPQTIGYAQADSPAALLAWIYEKLHDWTDDYPWTDDEVLTWVSVYMFSRAGAAAASRIYYETEKDAEGLVDRVKSWIPGVKLGMVRFPREIAPLPKAWWGTMGPVVLESEYDRGGHFAAWERPDAIVKDLRCMFGRGGGAEGVVPGRRGF